MAEDYTKLAERLNAAYVKAHPFHGPITAMDNDADLSLRDATGLIKQAQLEKQQILRGIEAQRGTQQELDQQRENVSLLPDREAERIQAGWRQEAARSAQSYASAKNRNAHPRSTIGTDPSITEGVISWIESKRKKQWFKKKAK